MARQGTRRWIAVLGMLCTAAFADEPQSVPRASAWITDHRVMAMARTRDTIYLGGDFKYLGPWTGYGFVSSTATGAVRAPALDINDQVNCAISDGRGGWFIGGAFTHVGGLTRQRLARIRPDGSPDPDWAADADADAECIVLSQDGTRLYVGGRFTLINGQIRTNLASLTALTGAVEAWSPLFFSTNLPQYVGALALSPDDRTLYVGGNFTHINGIYRPDLAALSTETAGVTAWDPPRYISYINTLSIAPDGNTVYLGGVFTNMGGQARRNLAAVTLAGAATAWNPNSSMAGITVSEILPAPSESAVYVAGTFSSLGGAARIGLAKVDDVNGNALAWDAGADAGVTSLERSPDSQTLYVGGGFSRIGGQSRVRMAAINAVSGVATSWFIHCNGSPLAAKFSTGGNLFIGGSFTSVGGVPRQYLAAVDDASGRVTAWNPGTDYMVDHVFLSRDGHTVYVAGLFTNVGGQARFRVAALDEQGQVTSWNPNPNNAVMAIEASPDGRFLYVGGAFTSIGGSSCNYLAVLDANGHARGWSAGANFHVEDLAFSPDGRTLYVSGAFWELGGQPRWWLGSVDTNGVATAWNPQPSFMLDDMVLSPDGRTLFISGDFDNIAGTPRNHLASVDATNGAVTAWAPNANERVYDLALSADRQTLYAVGSFTNISGQARRHLAAYALDGTLRSWNPGIDETTAAVAPAPNDQSLAVGGSFREVAGVSRRAFALFDSLAPTVRRADWSTGFRAVLTNLTVGSTATLERTASPIQPSWAFVTNTVVGSNTAASLTDAWPTNRAAIYRVRL